MDFWMIGTIGAMILILSVVPGVYLFWPSRSDPVCRSDLGVALMTGALIAFAVLVLQLMVDVRAKREEDARERQAERQNLELTIGLRKNLPEISLRNRDLSNFYLYDKEMPRAVLTGSDLTGTNLSKANLTEAFLDGTELVRTSLDGAALNKAVLAGARLEGANLAVASLEQAVLDGATLIDARFDGATLINAYLNGVKTVAPTSQFSRANLSNADLRGADLSHAYFEATVLTGALFDCKTRWPVGYKPKKACTPGEDTTMP